MLVKQLCRVTHFDNTLQYLQASPRLALLSSRQTCHKCLITQNVLIFLLPHFIAIHKYKNLCCCRCYLLYSLLSQALEHLLQEGPLRDYDSDMSQILYVFRCTHFSIHVQKLLVNCKVLLIMSSILYVLK